MGDGLLSCQCASSRTGVRGQRARQQMSLCASFLLLLTLSTSWPIAVAQQRSTPAPQTEQQPFARPPGKYGEDHRFGIMLGLIVTVGTVVVVGVTLFAHFCADDGRRRRERMHRRWRAGLEAGVPEPPQFHIIPPRWRRRLRRQLRRVTGTAHQPLENDAAQVAENDNHSSTSSSSSGGSEIDIDVAELNGGGNERQRQRLRRRLGVRADIVIPPAYAPESAATGRQGPRYSPAEQETSFTQANVADDDCGGGGDGGGGGGGGVVVFGGGEPLDTEPESGTENSALLSRVRADSDRAETSAPRASVAAGPLLELAAEAESGTADAALASPVGLAESVERVQRTLRSSGRGGQASEPEADQQTDSEHPTSCES